MTRERDILEISISNTNPAGRGRVDGATFLDARLEGVRVAGTHTQDHSLSEWEFPP